jgi:hypothetical protein
VANAIPEPASKRTHTAETNWETKKFLLEDSFPSKEVFKHCIPMDDVAI